MLQVFTLKGCNLTHWDKTKVQIFSICLCVLDWVIFGVWVILVWSAGLSFVTKSRGFYNGTVSSKIQKWHHPPLNLPPYSRKYHWVFSYFLIRPHSWGSVGSFWGDGAADVISLGTWWRVRLRTNLCDKPDNHPGLNNPTSLQLPGCIHRTCW